MSTWGKPERSGFFQLMRRVAGAFPWKSPIGTARHVADEPVRFGQAVQMTFATSTVWGWKRRRRPEPEPDPRRAPGATEGDAPALPLEPGRSRPRLLQNFFGLFGPNGPLPLHITARCVWQQDEKDTTLPDFADIFHHRMLTTFYRAWAKPRPGAGLVGGRGPWIEKDDFARRVAALLGAGDPRIRHGTESTEIYRLGAARDLVRQHRDAGGLQATLESFLRVRTRLQEFVPEWLPIPDPECSCLGVTGRNQRLGRSTVLGNRVYQAQGRFRIQLGPLSWERLRSFLPGRTDEHAALPQLIEIVRHWTGFHLHWDLQLVLRRDEIPELRLGGEARLGWTTWLRTEEPQEDARDTVFEPTRVAS